MDGKRGNGMIFINCMEKLTMNAPRETLKVGLSAALDAGIDGSTLAAGLHLGSFGMIEDHPRFRDAQLGIIVSSLRALQLFLRKSSRSNRLPDYVVVVAASNHPELLDRAVWRRFQLRLELPMPTRDQLTRQIETIGMGCETDFGSTAETVAKHMLGQNFAEVEEFCLGIVRRAILDRQTENALSITKRKLEEWRSRLKPKPAKSLNGTNRKSAGDA